jgi:hypothetical protein
MFRSETMTQNRWHIYEKHKAKISDIKLTSDQYEIIIRVINNAIFDAEELYKSPASERSESEQ